MLGILQAGVRSTAGMAKFTEITSLQVLGFVAAAFLAVVCHAVEFPVSFDANFVVTSNGNHAQVLDGGQVVNLALVEYSTATFASKSSYLFGSIGFNIKLAPGNSAGTVTTFFLASSGDAHDELDFEFLGNVSGQPYSLQTNVFAHGVGNREQRINLWFDPTAEFHSYTLRWTRELITFFVDDTPIRVFRNNEAIGVPYLNSQAMPILAAVWDGSTWATQGGKYPIDWAYQPFVASYQGFGVDGCLVVNNDISYCAAGPVDAWWNAQHYQYLTPEQITTLKHVQSNYVYYDYCNDKVRYPIVPPECVKNWYGS